jgi:thymidylate synthase
MIITEQTAVVAWQEVAKHLVANGGHTYNILVSIQKPTYIDEDLLTTFDPCLIDPDLDRLSDVANTIFPRKTHANSNGRADLYGRYMRAHSKAKSKRWGTYFLRMICFGSSRVNQLERVIVALTSWKNSSRAALTIHISSAETDKLKPLGNPCLQYLQFNCPDSQTVDLVAIYRNHDYCNKALGNFIGLGRLLEFVCKESELKVGTLTCLSVRAYYDVPKKIQMKLAKLEQN